MDSRSHTLQRAVAALLATAALLASVLALGQAPASAQISQPGFDMALSVEEPVGSFDAGDTIVFEMTAQNIGTTTAVQVFFSAYVPRHTVLNLAASTPGFQCSPLPATVGANCTTEVGNIAAGDTVSVVFAVDVVSPLPADATETIFWPGCDPDPNAPGPDYNCIPAGVFVGGSPFAELSYDNNWVDPITVSLGSPCQPGTFSATGNAPCEPAAIGSYVDTVGATTTTPCPAGTSTIGLGSASAADCLVDFDADGTPDVVDPDDDNDGVDDPADRCAETDLADDTAPARLKRNRFWSDASGVFGGSGYTVADTGGCSASQIIDAAGLGNGHRRFGISRSALREWIASA